MNWVHLIFWDIPLGESAFALPPPLQCQCSAARSASASFWGRVRHSAVGFSAWMLGVGSRVVLCRTVGSEKRCSHVERV
jgi:hypothetical protein